MYVYVYIYIYIHTYDRDIVYRAVPYHTIPYHSLSCVNLSYLIRHVSCHTTGLHNKIPAHKIFARVWVAQKSFFIGSG